MAIFDEKIEIRERWPIFPGLDQALFPPMVFLVFWDSIPKRCKGVHCLDLGESFPTSIYLQSLASIQPRTSLVKFARSPRIDPPGELLDIAGQSCGHSLDKQCSFPAPWCLLLSIKVDQLREGIVP